MFREKLAPTVNVFTVLFNALSENVDDINRMNTLLGNLIAQRPEIITQEPEDIFISRVTLMKNWQANFFVTS